jgi:endoglucanase
MDNKTGLWVCIEALRRAKERGGLRVAVFAVSTVQEEIGLRGAITSAYGVNPHVGVAVDVTHATDCPTIDKTQEGDIKLGGGPVIYRGPNMNPVVVERLRAAAESANIKVQWGASGRGTGTDANAIQLARGGVAAGLVSVPNRYMHSAVEMISLDDIDQSADLLAEFVLGIESDCDFTPR